MATEILREQAVAKAIDAFRGGIRSLVLVIRREIGVIGMGGELWRATQTDGAKDIERVYREIIEDNAYPDVRKHYNLP